MYFNLLEWLTVLLELNNHLELYYCELCGQRSIQYDQPKHKKIVFNPFNLRCNKLFFNNNADKLSRRIINIIGEQYSISSNF